MLRAVAFRDYLAEEVALDCAEGAMSRREALRRLALLGVTGPAAAAVLAAVPRAASAFRLDASSHRDGAGLDPTDRRGRGDHLSRPNGDLIGVYAAADSAKGAVLVIHENRG